MRMKSNTGIFPNSPERFALEMMRSYYFAVTRARHLWSLVRP
jgi:hypothetical protein